MVKKHDHFKSTVITLLTAILIGIGILLILGFRAAYKYQLLV